MTYKITYIKREVVNPYLPTERTVDSEEMTVVINAKNTDEARKLFYTENAHCFIKTIERNIPRITKRSKGAKTNPKELAKREEKKLLKKEKTKKWLKKPYKNKKVDKEAKGKYLKRVGLLKEGQKK